MTVNKRKIAAGKLLLLLGGAACVGEAIKYSTVTTTPFSWLQLALLIMFGAYALIRFTKISEDRKRAAVTVGMGVVLMITWPWSFWPGLLLLAGSLVCYIEASE